MLLLTKLPTSDSFRPGEGGGCGVCKSYCLCLSCFYAVTKLTGTYLHCWTKENGWFEAVKVFERPSLTHTSPSSSAWSDALSCYMEPSQLPRHLNPGIHGKCFWPVCWYVMSQRGKAANVSPLGTGVRMAEWFWGGGKTWSPLIISNFIFQPVNLIPLQLLFLFFTSRRQMVQRFSWVYY